MLSAKYHLIYWVTSAASAATYRGLISGLGLDEATPRTLLIPLGAYALYVLLVGPRTRQSNGFHIATTGLLMVLLGTVAECFYLPGVDPRETKEIAHTCLAFSAAASLEPVRQNVSPVIYSSRNQRSTEISPLTLIDSEKTSRCINVPESGRALEPRWKGHYYLRRHSSVLSIDSVSSLVYSNSSLIWQAGGSLSALASSFPLRTYGTHI